MVHGIPNISVPTIGYPVVQGAKMALPVEPSSLIYSHFEHVSGIAAPKGTQGVTISKLNLLDVLIGQLNQVNRGKTALPPAAVVPAEQMDSLIKAYSEQLRQVKAASANMPYIPSPSAQSGSIFSIII